MIGVKIQTVTIQLDNGRTWEEQILWSDNHFPTREQVMESLLTKHPRLDQKYVDAIMEGNYKEAFVVPIIGRK
jgi:hypothetical protein